jgi:hypothetical protein
LAARLAGDAQEILLVHVHPYGPLSTLVPDSEYETLVRGVAESRLTAVQDTLGPTCVASCAWCPTRRRRPACRASPRRLVRR